MDLWTIWDVRNQIGWLCSRKRSYCTITLAPLLINLIKSPYLLLVGMKMYTYILYLSILYLVKLNFSLLVKLFKYKSLCLKKIERFSVNHSPHINFYLVSRSTEICRSVMRSIERGLQY